MSLVRRGLTGVIVALCRPVFNMEKLTCEFHIYYHELQQNNNASQNESIWKFQ